MYTDVTPAPTTKISQNSGAPQPVQIRKKKNSGGAPKKPGPTRAPIPVEVLAGSQNVSEIPEFYGRSRAERRLRKFKPGLVAENLRRRSASSYEAGAPGDHADGRFGMR
jgi:hypothetical protein